MPVVLLNSRIVGGPEVGQKRALGRAKNSGVTRAMTNQKVVKRLSNYGEKSVISFLR
jgi:hypothetical protein